MTLGSLFSGIGGFELAAVHNGIEPVWASEIEPFPIKVTKHHFPNMKHYGDITKINGAEIEPVDIISGGSPCQDLSVAGKRAGLEGARSGLFMEMVRIIKEMRLHTNGLYPRYVVWENVPGAFSSNSGEDFRIVIEEFCKIADETVSIPRPAKDKWNTAGCVMGNGFSFAWRVIDAQFWGVPQRRRRIYAVLDIGGQSAPEILFVEQGNNRNFAESGETREGIAGDVEGGVGKAISFGPTSSRIHIEPKVSVTLQAGQGGLGAMSGLYCLQGSMIGRQDHNGPQGDGINEDAAFTLNTIDRHAVAYGICSDNSNSMKSSNPFSGIYEAETSRTIDQNGGSPACNQGGMAIVSQINCQPSGISGTVSSKWAKGTGGPAGDEHYNLVVAGCDFRNDKENGDLCGTLQAKPTGGQSLNCIHPVRVGYSVRRLTPLECERLQGFPDGWTDIPGASDSGRYKALGNSIAVCCADFVMRGIGGV